MVNKSWADRQKSEDGSSSETRGPEYAVAAGDRHGHPDLTMHASHDGKPRYIPPDNGRRLESISEKPVAAGDRHGEPEINGMNKNY